MNQLNGPAPGNETGTVTPMDGAALPAVPQGADRAGPADQSAPDMAALADPLRAPAGTAAPPRPASKTSGASFAAAAGTASGNDTTESAAPIGVLPAASTAAPATAALSAEQTASAVALALIEGSDATGASASAVQASGSAAAAAGNAAQGPMLQTAGVPAPSTAAVATVTLTVADASAATLGDADKHARGGAGDSAFSGNGGEGAAAFQQFGFEGAATGPGDAGAASPTHLKVDASIDSAEFPQGLAERVAFMADNNLNGARLQVNPQELGPIELTIAVQGDHAQVWMSTHSAVTRDALESSLPKLRDMLGAQGFGQVSVDISQRSFQDRSAYSRAYEPAPRSVESATADVPSPQSTPRASLSALDTYA